MTRAILASCLSLAVLGLSSASLKLTSADNAGWSKPVNGLRARLLVLDPQEPNPRFCRFFIEFENVADVMGQKHIRFATRKIKLRVTNQTGKDLAIATTSSYDGLSPDWEAIALPYAGVVKFQISFPGLGYNPATDKVIIDVGAGAAWVIPQDDSIYYLSRTLSIAPEERDHPYMDWSGVLDLPRVAIPKAKQ